MYSPPGNRIQLPPERDLAVGSLQSIRPVNGVAKVSPVPVRVQLMGMAKQPTLFGTMFYGTSFQYDKTGAHPDLMCLGYGGPTSLYEWPGTKIVDLASTGIIAMGSTFALVIVRSTNVVRILKPSNNVNWSIVATQTIATATNFYDVVITDLDEVLLRDGTNHTIQVFTLVGNSLVLKQIVPTSGYPNHNNMSILTNSFGILATNHASGTPVKFIVRDTTTGLWSVQTPPYLIHDLYKFTLAPNKKHGVCIGLVDGAYYPFTLDGTNINVDISNLLPSPIANKKVSDISFCPGTNFLVACYEDGWYSCMALLQASDAFCGAIPEEIYDTEISTALGGVY